MKLKATPNIKGSIVETTVSIDDFGSSEYSAEEEKELFEDYSMILDYGKLLFSRWVTVDGHKNPVIVEAPQEQEPTNEPPTEPTEETTGPDNIVLAMPIGESYELDADFELHYAVDVRALGDQYKMFKNIKDNVCLAKAMCLVFEDCIISYIKDQFEIAKTHKDDFETVRYYEI